MGAKIDNFHIRKAFPDAFILVDAMEDLEAVRDAAKNLLQLWDDNEIAPHYAADPQIISDAFEQLRKSLGTEKTNK